MHPGDEGDRGWFVVNNHKSDAIVVTVTGVRRQFNGPDQESFTIHDLLVRSGERVLLGCKYEYSAHYEPSHEINYKIDRACWSEDCAATTSGPNPVEPIGPAVTVQCVEACLNGDGDCEKLDVTTAEMHTGLPLLDTLQRLSWVMWNVGPQDGPRQIAVQALLNYARTANQQRCSRANPTLGYGRFVWGGESCTLPFPEDPGSSFYNYLDLRGDIEGDHIQTGDAARIEFSDPTQSPYVLFLAKGSAGTPDPELYSDRLLRIEVDIRAMDATFLTTESGKCVMIQHGEPDPDNSYDHAPD